MSLLESAQLSSSGDKPPLLSWSPGRPHTTPLNGVGWKEAKKSNSDGVPKLLAFSVGMLFFRAAL